MTRRPDRPSWPELARLQGRFQELLEQALGGLDEGLEGPASGAWKPCVDLVETAEGYLLYAELPGVFREDVELRAEGRFLDLSGQRRTLEGDHTFARLERHYGRFHRRIELSTAVDPDRIEARLENGVLEVRIPAATSGARVEIGEG